MLRMMAPSYYHNYHDHMIILSYYHNDDIIILSYYHIIILSYYHFIMLLPDHNTKWLKSFSVPSPGFRHILSLLPLLQGSLPKNKGTSGNNFLRRICHRGLKNHSPFKTSLF